MFKLVDLFYKYKVNYFSQFIIIMFYLLDLGCEILDPFFKPKRSAKSDLKQNVFVKE